MLIAYDNFSILAHFSYHVINDLHSRNKTVIVIRYAKYSYAFRNIYIQGTLFLEKKSKSKQRKIKSLMEEEIP